MRLLIHQSNVSWWMSSTQTCMSHRRLVNHRGGSHRESMRCRRAYTCTYRHPAHESNVWIVNRGSHLMYESVMSQMRSSRISSMSHRYQWDRNVLPHEMFVRWMVAMSIIVPVIICTQSVWVNLRPVQIAWAQMRMSCSVSDVWDTYNEPV